jgi:hypothetical protein
MALTKAHIINAIAPKKSDRGLSLFLIFNAFNVYFGL